MGGVLWKLNLFMLSQKYSNMAVVWRSLSKLQTGNVRWHIYADYRHCTGLAGCIYGVIFKTSHYFFVIVKSLMELIRFIYYLIMHIFLMRAFVEDRRAALLFEY